MSNEKKSLPNKTIQVACAIIEDSSGNVLVTQRSATMSLPLKWEFPGGKIETGETEEETILREIREELNIEISISQKLESVIHAYPNFTIVLVPFICTHKTGEIKLTEHQAYRWLNPNNLLALDLAEADIPVAQNYLNTLNQ